MIDVVRARLIEASRFPKYTLIFDLSDEKLLPRIVAELPGLLVFDLTLVIVGQSEQPAVTVIVAVELSAVPQALVTRTQK